MLPHLEETIRERAYQIWLAGGCRHGEDEHDWLTAEREVLGATSVQPTAEAAAPQAGKTAASAARRSRKRAAKR